MALCKVDRSSLEKALDNYNTLYEEMKVNLKREFEIYKANYKFSILDKILGNTRLSGRDLWDLKENGWYHPTKYLLGDAAHELHAFMYQDIPMDVLTAVQSLSDDIYLSGRTLEFYVKYKGE